MTTSNITHPFMAGRSQAIRIPKEYSFADDEEVYINRIGDSIIITPTKALASTFFSGASLLDNDFMSDGRPGETPTVREALD